MWLGSEQAMIDLSKLMAKRGLSTYCLYLGNTLQEKALKDKFKSGDKEKIENAVQSTLDWLSGLDENNLVEEAEILAKQKLLVGIVQPIMDRADQVAVVEPGHGASGGTLSATDWLDAARVATSPNEPA